MSPEFVSESKNNSTERSFGRFALNYTLSYGAALALAEGINLVSRVVAGHDVVHFDHARLYEGVGAGVLIGQFIAPVINAIRKGQS